MSTNGVDWQSRSFNITGTSPTSHFGALTFGNGTFVVGGDLRTIIQSQPVVQLGQPEPGLLSVAGLRDRTYAIQATENLALGTSAWQTVATMTLSNEPSVWRDPATNQAARFYRAVWLP